MTRSAAFLLVVAASTAVPASAGVVLVRARGAQVDEAVAAFKAERGGAVPELVVDDTTDAAALVALIAERGGDKPVVVGIGARAAQLAMKQSVAPVVHCMVLQDAGALDGPRSVGVPLSVPAAAQLRVIKLVAPRTRSVALVYDPKLNAAFAADAQAAAKVAGVTLELRAVSSGRDAAAAMDTVLGTVDALLLVPDATVISKDLLSFVALRSIERRVAVFGYSEALVRLGLVAALAPSYAQNGKLCAQLARRVEAGEAPASLRGKVQMGGVLVINQGVARRIDLAVPAELLKSPSIVVGQ